MDRCLVIIHVERGSRLDLLVSWRETDSLRGEILRVHSDQSKVSKVIDLEEDRKVMVLCEVIGEEEERRMRVVVRGEEDRVAGSSR